MLIFKYKNIRKCATRRAVRLYGPIFKYEGFVRAVGWHSCLLYRWFKRFQGTSTVQSKLSNWLDSCQEIPLTSLIT